jgi:hypothetical protein
MDNSFKNWLIKGSFSGLVKLLGRYPDKKARAAFNFEGLSYQNGLSWLAL